MSTDHHECGAPLSIGAAAEHLGVSVETLRYYEAEGLVAPERDGVRRIYSQRDLDALHVVCTMRDAGFGIAEVRQLIDVKTDEPPNVLVARARAQLLEFRREVARRQKALRASKALIDRWLEELDSTGF